MDRERVKAESKLLYRAIRLTHPGPNGLLIRTRIVEGLDEVLAAWLILKMTSCSRRSGSLRDTL